MREKHCAFAVLNHFGRCIAYCRYNLDTRFRRDCTGLDAEGETDEKEFLQEIHISGGSKI